MRRIKSKKKRHIKKRHKAIVARVFKHREFYDFTESGDPELEHLVEALSGGSRDDG